MQENSVQAKLRVLASKDGWCLWRNNVGVLFDSRGIPVRFGLLNDSKQINAVIKSSDLIGIKPGGIFVAREVKRPGWKFNPNDPREKAQKMFIDMINLLGGDAAFSTGEL